MWYNKAQLQTTDPALLVTVGVTSNLYRRLLMSDHTPAKRCGKCNKNKSIDLFAKNKNRSDGLDWQCKTCTAEYRAINKEKIANKKHEYAAANREQINQRAVDWRAAHRDELAKRRAK